jgi:genome maintenance exonuclease 1
MNFKHIEMPIGDLLGYDDLICVTPEVGSRTYETPNGANKYPSITSVLSLQSRDAINKWKEKVGHEAANKISKKASLRGTAVHQIAEDYIAGSTEPSIRNPFYQSDFIPIKNAIDDGLSLVYAQEVALYSDHLKVAGRADCVGVYDGVLSIIDFKTSKMNKRKEWLTNYFLQETFYAIAFEERTKIPITQLVTIIAVDGEPNAQVFIEHRDNWDKKLIQCIKEYTYTEYYEAWQ